MARLIVFEDEPNIRRLLAVLFAGYDTVFRPDGEDALRLVRELRPAVIVLDLKLPKTSGVEILSGIHQDPALREIPVIVISGSMELLGDPVVRHSAVLLRKPFDIFVLKGLVDQALSGAHPTPPAE